ncbi:MAG: nuclear transport factor 2 family protein [Edaphobacter sp.]
MQFFDRQIRNALVVAVATCTIVAATYVPLASAAGSRARKHDVKRQVEALEEQWRTARLTGDMATMDRLLSEDYIGISMTGQVSTKAQQLERVRDHRTTLTRLDLVDMHVKLIGSIAIVTSRAEVQGLNEGRVVAGTYRYTRVYQRVSNGNWKITSFEATRIKSREARDSKQNDNAKILSGRAVTEP